MKNQLMYFILLFALAVGCKKDKKEEQHASFHTFEGDIGTNDNSTIVTSDNNLVICGNVNQNFILLKITKDGNQIWRKDFSAGMYSFASALVETSNHDFLIVGTNGYGKILLVKTNSTGDTIWTKTYGSYQNEYGNYIIKTNDNNYLIAANVKVDASSTRDIYLIKVNVDGDTLWTKCYQNPSYEDPYHLMQTQNGEYLVTGLIYDINPNYGLYFLKVDAGGNKLWDKTIGAGTGRIGSSTIELPGGDLLTCGTHGANGYTEALFVKADNSGNVYWEKEFGGTYLVENFTSIKSNSDGTFTMTGSSSDAVKETDDIILLKADQYGNQIWFKNFRGSENVGGINLIKDTNGDNIITGETSIYGSTANRKIFMTKTDNNGNFK